MTCSKCTRKIHARGMCASHYVAWYRENREQAKRDKPHHIRKWKFTPDHWRKWLEKRAPDERTLELRAGIKALRYGLP